MNKRFVVYVPSKSHWGAGRRKFFITLDEAKEECEFWFSREGLVLAIEQVK